MRMNRVVLVLRAPAMLQLITSKYPKVMRYLGIVKPLGFLFFIWHLASTAWMWFNIFIEKKGNFEIFWLEFLELEHRNVF
mmetsp:Transcript_7218/g.6495  ORF Transcript_7218/g.6495 Transcript_7218/m.6495 type:complete len:80 (-) Transcript_7218:617-856(-)